MRRSSIEIGKKKGDAAHAATSLVLGFPSSSDGESSWDGESLIPSDEAMGQPRDYQIKKGNKIESTRSPSTTDSSKVQQKSEPEFYHKDNDFESDFDDDSSVIDSVYTGTGTFSFHGLALPQVPSAGSSTYRITNYPGLEIQELPRARVLSDISDRYSHHQKEGKWWYPGWMERAPCWVQIAMMAGVGLLLGAILIVIVGVALNSKNETKRVTATEQIPDFRMPSDPVPTPAPSSGPSNTPTASPTVLANAFPTGKPSNSPTVPTEADTQNNTMTVYLTAGFFSDEIENEALDLLGHLPTEQGTSFIIHMGNCADPGSTKCDKKTYDGIINLFRQSSIPTYFVTGKTEFTNCEKPEKAYKHWKESLLYFETDYFEPPPWEIMRQGDLEILENDHHKEHEDYVVNFLFAHNQFAFLSVNLVREGQILDQTEADKRNQANLVWIETAYQIYRNDVDTIFILANDAPPGIGSNRTGSNDQFFRDLFVNINDIYVDMRFVLVYNHENSDGSRWRMDANYNGLRNLDTLSFGSGSNSSGPAWPPLRMTVKGTYQKRVISLEIDW